jgi:RND family efflux transporter MFP subunit
VSNQGHKRFFLNVLHSVREYYPIVVVYSVCISILTLATPISVQSLINTFSFGPYFQPLFVLSLVLFGLLALRGAISSLQYILVEYLQRKVFARSSASVVRSYVIKRHHKELTRRDLYYANRFFDIVIVQKSIAKLVTELISISLQTVIGVILISLYHPFFILFGVFILLAIFLPIRLFYNRACASAVIESTRKHEIADFVDEIALNTNPDSEIRDIIRCVNTVDSRIGDYIDSREVHFASLFRMHLIFVGLFAFLNALLLALGGYLVISNQLTVGQLVAAEIVVNAILYSFLKAKDHLETFFDMYAAAEKIQIFDQRLTAEDKAALNDAKEFLINVKESDPQFQNSLKSVRDIHSPKNYRGFARNFAIGFVVFLIVLALTPWQQTSIGQGKVTALDPNDRPQFITANVKGIIESWLVQDGQYVKKGDPIVKIQDNDPNYLVRLEAARDAAIAKFEAAKESSTTARLNYRRQLKLEKEGLSSRKEFEKAKITYKKLISEEAEAAASLAKAETDLSRQSLQEIVAPRDGRILRILHGSGTVNIKAGEKLVEFVPSTDKHAVEIFVDGNDLPLVYVGREVRLQFEGWPAVQFRGWPSVAVGSFGGIVTAVDPSVADNGRFRVLVSPDPKDIDWPDRTILRQGARAVGLILLEQVSLGYEIWRKVNGFPKSMDNPPGTEKKVKAK